MAQTVKIISDSTCDLSKDLLEKYDIAILPLHILLGETEYRDGVDITPEEIFRWSDENIRAWVWPVGFAPPPRGSIPTGLSHSTKTPTCFHTQIMI